jgi:hypothetical protein
MASKRQHARNTNVLDSRPSAPLNTPDRPQRQPEQAPVPPAVASSDRDASHQPVVAHTFTCHSQTVVTNVTAHDDAPLIAAPLIPGVTGYDMQTASLLTGLTRGYIRWLLHTYPERFDKRHIQLRRVSNQPSSRWPKRILTNRDVQTLRDMYPVVVKEISPR